MFCDQREYPESPPKASEGLYTFTVHLHKDTQAFGSGGWHNKSRQMNWSKGPMPPYVPQGRTL